MMSLLVRNEVLVSPSPPGSAEISATTETWMGVFLATGERVGFVHMRSEPQERQGRPGTLFLLTGQVEMALFGATTELSTLGTGWAPVGMGIEQFQGKLRSGDHQFAIAGSIDGDLLRATVESAGETFPLTFPVPAEGLRIGYGTLTVPRLGPGEQTVVEMYDPLSLSMGRAHLAYEGEETFPFAGEAVHTTIVSTELNGVRSRAWVGDDGTIYQAEVPFGLVLKRITSEEALAGQSQTNGESLVNILAVHPEGLRPFRGARRMVLDLADTPAPETIPTGGVQRWQENGTLIIEMPSEQTVLALDSPEAVSAEDESLAPDPLVQSDHEDIRRTATEVVGVATSRWEKVQLLNSWVYENIEKKSTLSLPSAIDVLKTREGDCNEHTVLYTALARAVGIPTRMAIGVVWSDELGAFFYHAWPEVLMGEWVPVDPTLGQPVADATHLRLLTGGLQSWFRLVPFLGQMQVKVVEVE